MGATAAGALLLCIGIWSAAAGLGLITRRRWGLWLSVALFAVNFVGEFVQMLFVERDLTGRGVAGAAISAAFFYFLFLPASRNYFSATTGETTS